MSSPDSPEKAPTDPPRKKRIVIIGNKAWETDPLLGVILSDDRAEARPSGFTELRLLAHPKMWRPPGCADPGLVPRADLAYGAAHVEVWCLADLVAGSSVTSAKATAIPRILESGPVPDLVVAFGTAASPEADAMNGSVVIGSAVYVHDPFASLSPDERKKRLMWTDPKVGHLLPGNIPKDVIDGIRANARGPVELRFLVPPVHPARPAVFVAGSTLVSVGVVNVTNYDDYLWTDPEALRGFEERCPKSGRVVSVETTHGVIRLVGPDVPFLYVSGIANRVRGYDMETAPRVYAQNFVAAHNAAVALAWSLPAIVAGLK